MLIKKTFKTIFLIATISILSVNNIASATVTTPKIQDNKSKKVYVQEQIMATELAIKKLNAQSSEIEGEIKEIDDIVMSVELEIQEIEARLSTTNQTLSAVDYEKSVLANNLEESKIKFEETTAHLTGGDKEYIDYINDANDTYTLNNRMELLSMAYSVYETAVAKYEKEFVYANAKEGTAKMEKERLEYDREIVLKKKEFVETQIEKKNTLLSEVVSEREEYEHAHDYLEEMSLQIENIIVELQEELKRNNATYTVVRADVNGKLHWPSATSNKMTSQYGKRTHPVTGKKGVLHAGLDIGAAKGTSVLAAENGKVIASTWIGGYGNAIMIDHGEGLVTLYGHNSKLTAKVGQEVKRGQKVAEVGSTGRSTGNHIHFEVRINGKAVNPLPYLQ